MLRLSLGQRTIARICRLPTYRPLQITLCRVTTPPSSSRSGSVTGKKTARLPRGCRPARKCTCSICSVTSGDGLHVGHPEGYTATDIVCRFNRMRGKSVVHPMGFDSFGLPAEEAAINKGIPPEDHEKKHREFSPPIKTVGVQLRLGSRNWRQPTRPISNGRSSSSGVVRHLVRPDPTAAAGRSVNFRFPMRWRHDGEAAVARHIATVSGWRINMKRR